MEIRYDLIPPHGLNEVNKVFSTKLEKYEKINGKTELLGVKYFPI